MAQEKNDQKPEGFKLKPLGDLWENLSKGESNSLLKKYLTPKIYAELKDKKTALGGSLGACIQSGCENLQSGVGIYACDPEAYDVYSELFDPIIKDYHKVDKIYHPKTDWGTDAQVKKLEDLDPSGKYIVSTRVRVGRSHQNMPFPPTVTNEQRKTMETNTVKALEKLDGELKGTYFPLQGMPKATEKQLIEDHFLFKDDDSCLGSAGGYTFWPQGRGIFHNNNKTFLTWINEEDHLRFISMQQGGNLGEVYCRLRTALAHLEKTIPFATKDGKLGSLTFCPTNLGTAMRASVHIRIPFLGANQKKLDEVCAKNNLQPRGIHGEHTESVGGVYDISNKRRMGLTEWEAVTEMKDGILAIMEEEKKIAAGYIVEDVAKLYGMIKDGESKSLLKKHLTPKIYEDLKDKKTALGGTLAACIQSGCKNLKSGVGIYACDPEAYTVFAALFDPIIKDYHGIKGDKISHPKPDWGTGELGDLDPKGEYIVSTRVRVGRSHKGLPFPPTVTNEQRLKMEKMTAEALDKLDGGLKGKYYPLQGMSKKEEKQLIEDHFLFKDDDDCLGTAGGYTFWPQGRGIFHNEKKSFLTWINEEDHLRFISMQMGGNLGEVYGRLRTALAQLEKTIPFATKPELGSLTFCPTNLGTAMRASVHIRVPNLANNNKLDDICAKHNLQPRGIHGEHTESVGGVYDISNKRRMGLTEWEAVNEMKTGILEIMKAEKELGAASKK